MEKEKIKEAPTAKEPQRELTMNNVIALLKLHIDNETYMATKFNKNGNILAELDCVERVRQYNLCLDFARHYISPSEIG